MIIPVVLSGGVGSRLWPVSRESYPKQFLPLVNEQLSLLQETVNRTQLLKDLGPVIAVCNDNHRFLVAEQMRQLNLPATILLEPEGKNTAPAAALAALQAVTLDPDAIILLLPADHVIRNTEKFQAAAEQAVALAREGYLVAFGVVPDKPETGYGYIQAGQRLPQGQGLAITKFVEKPDLARAKTYVASGDYYWNSGMFVLRAQTYLDELKRLQPAILGACTAAFAQSHRDLDFIRVDAKEFARCPADSIDYAVMEHTERGAVVPLDSGWSDVGAWSTLWDVADKDTNGNVLCGDTVLSDVSNSYIRCESRMVAAVGIDNLVVIETADAVLVAEKSRVQDVKNIVNQLVKSKRNEATLHTRVYRPWGSYESLVSDGRFQVKRIVVNPGHTLSLQMHHHRAEHWIVVKGTAKVTCDDREFLMSEDQSTYIPLGNRHRLANPGVIPLEIIEVQTGSYLGEDDIVRFDDVYGRSDKKAEEPGAVQQRSIQKLSN
jgi:mannose-1-phosphate guanylyltransferase / mannose-6-phosphate isomerase